MYQISPDDRIGGTVGFLVVEFVWRVVRAHRHEIDKEDKTRQCELEAQATCMHNTDRKG